MANRGRNTGKVENTIETFRTEGKWEKVIELAEELKAGSPSNSKFSCDPPFHERLLDGVKKIKHDTNICIFA